MRSIFSLSVCLLLTANLVGCGSSASDPATDPPVPVAPPVGESSNQDSAKPVTAKTDEAGQTERKFSGISFQIPNSWNEIPNQEFVDAKFTIEHELGEMQLTMTTAGGGIQANLDRWIGQYQRPAGEGYEQETINLNGGEATWLDVRGTYTSGFGANQKTLSNARMLGVAIPNQPRDFFLKLTGPRDAVADFHDEFRAFVKAGKLDN